MTISLSRDMCDAGMFFDVSRNHIDWLVRISGFSHHVNSLSEISSNCYFRYICIYIYMYMLTGFTYIHIPPPPRKSSQLQLNMKGTILFFPLLFDIFSVVWPTYFIFFGCAHTCCLVTWQVMRICFSAKNPLANLL